MKTNGTQKIALAVLLQLLFFVIHFSLHAQPKYDFRNASLISGTDLQPGALYSFPNVRSGVDALVSITNITGGLTINTLDGTSSGFAEAFQPVITLPANSKGYAEFSITFVTSGTATPLVQTEVPVTPIDVDGVTGTIYEFDEVYRYGSSYVDYSLVGGELQLLFPAANLVTGTNTSGITYDGVDTTQKGVMFTVVNSNISSMVVRVGADNTSSQSLQRLRSLYFQKFTYPNSVLALSPLQRSGYNNSTNSQCFKVFPSAITNTTKINFNSSKSGTAALRLIDYSGRMVMQKAINVNEGNNNYVINDLDHLSAGNYIVLLTHNNNTYNQKIMKQ